MNRRAMMGSALAACGVAPWRAYAAGGPPAVAAASDLSSALPQVAAAFQARTGQAVRLTFGSSGNFTQQIRNGAPFEVFLSADEDYVDDLAKAGRTVGAGALYAIGRLGLFAPHGSVVRVDPALKGLAAAIQGRRVRNFAIANPEHAPYGRAAREVLQHAGLWTGLQGRLVLAENVSQATQFAISGGADAGMIPLSLALTAPVKAAGAFALVPADWHRPLRQRGVLIRNASPAARAFFAFLQGREARAILARHGFALPRGG